VEYKADVNVRRHKDRSTSLHIASSKGNNEIVKILLENNANVNVVRNKDDYTPLLDACKNGHVATVKLLLDSKACVNTFSKKDGSTPLFKRMFQWQCRNCEIIAREQS